MAKTLEEKRAYMREWRAKNKDHIKEYKRQWNADNPDKVKEANEKWREENPDKVKEANKQWREDNPDYNKEWSAEHKEERAEYMIEYRKTLHGRASMLLSGYNWMDKERGFPHGDLTADDVEEIIQKPCAHCGKVGWDVIGLNRIDNSKPHTKANVEPCCFSCNCRLNGIEVQAKRKQNSN